MGIAAKHIVRALLEDDPDAVRAKDYLPYLDSQMPSPKAEMAGIERWVRDTSNATGEGAGDWEWDFNSRILVIKNQDGTDSTFTGKEIADSTPGDWRLNRLRGP